MSLILLGICLVTIAGIIALAHSIVHTEVGYEDGTGFHRGEPPVPIMQNPDWKKPDLSPVPQIYPNGSACPWGLDPDPSQSKHLPA